MGSAGPKTEGVRRLKVVVNGQDKDVRAAITIAALLEEEGEPADHVLVEVDGRFIPPRQWQDRRLSEGERVEIILPAFGG